MCSPPVFFWKNYCFVFHILICHSFEISVLCEVLGRFHDYFFSFFPYVDVIDQALLRPSFKEEIF